MFLPSVLALEVKQSAWIVPIFVPLGIGSLALWGACKLKQQFPGLTIIEYSEVVVGKVLGKVLTASFILFLLSFNIQLIWDTTGFLSITLLPKTPALILNLSMVLLGAYIVPKGIEVIARMAQFVLPLFLMAVVFVIVLAMRDFEFGNILPMLEGGVLPIVKNSLAPAYIFGEVGLLTLFLPMVNESQVIGRKMLMMLVAAAGSLSAVILTTILVFGPEVTGSYVYSFFALAKFVQAGRYIQRVESLISILWITGITIKMALLFYLCSVATAQCLGLKSYKSVAYLLTMVQGALLIFLGSVSVIQMQIIDNYLQSIGLGFELALPFFLLLTAIIKKKWSTR